MVEIAPSRSKINLTSWQWPLWVSLILFLLVAGVFIFLKFFLNTLRAEISDINDQIKTESAKVSVNDENLVIQISNSLNAFKDIQMNHSYFSGLMDLIESLTYSKVAFAKIDVGRDKNLIQLRGTAQNYTALAKQMVALRENENIRTLEVRGISFGTTGLTFELTMEVDPKVFIEK